MEEWRRVQWRKTLSEPTPISDSVFHRNLKSLNVHIFVWMEPWSLIHPNSYRCGRRLPEYCQITRREESCTKGINQTVINSALCNLQEGRGLSGRSWGGRAHCEQDDKSARPDNLTAEHLKFGGQAIIIWLTEILNSIVDAEQIPLWLRITIPVYKRGAKAPLNANNITLNSVMSKVETVILNRLEPRLMEDGLPHSI